MEKPPTMADVARMAGVHKATASRALDPRTSGQVSQATARRVLAAAKRLAYTPNTMARSLRTNRSKTVGVLIPDLTNPLFPPVVRGIESVLSPRGYTALIANTDNDEAVEAAGFEAMLARQVDGFILATGRREDALVSAAYARALSVVLINRGTDRPLFPLVTGDDTAGIAAAVGHLLRLGHRRLAHLAGPSDMTTGFVRERAFRQAVATRGLDPVVIGCDGYTIESGKRGMSALLSRRGAHPTGIVAGNDLIAIGALHALRERGLRCPQDISLVGFNDMPFADELQPPLTTVHVPHHEMGAEAARMLLDELDGAPATGKTVILPLTLVVRGSTAPPP
jgi:LacI family transcriptional regulator